MGKGKEEEEEDDDTTPNVSEDKAGWRSSIDSGKAWPAMLQAQV